MWEGPAAQRLAEQMRQPRREARYRVGIDDTLLHSTAILLWRSDWNPEPRHASGFHEIYQKAWQPYVAASSGSSQPNVRMVEVGSCRGCESRQISQAPDSWRLYNAGKINRPSKPGETRRRATARKPSVRQCMRTSDAGNCSVAVSIGRQVRLQTSNAWFLYNLQ